MQDAEVAPDTEVHGEAPAAEALEEDLNSLAALVARRQACWRMATLC
jgi:hypothetical protein